MKRVQGKVGDEPYVVFLGSVGEHKPDPDEPDTITGVDGASVAALRIATTVPDAYVIATPTGPLLRVTDVSAPSVIDLLRARTAVESVTDL